MGVAVATALHLLPTRRAIEAGAGLAGDAWDAIRRTSRGAVGRSDPA
jgi:hypothetical protein